ncbi:hypothetical protein GCM10011391_37220 [Pullulanibacillus camelliae]|uniref:SH3b domain-containing protein n=1 Tax=Pullulanibacillus camelliae TaxID=1707096 RepID=A0A8J3E0M0_9BACL|nr:SH3 domain-containing protein [Pullulanibacillus camelliae]GGE54801.1 hypothetical protein GCM10011391_37220 [Pullulanibacillus camelliae]
MKIGRLGAAFLALALLFSISPFYAKANSVDTGTVTAKTSENTATVYAQEGRETVDITKEATPDSELLVSIPSESKVAILDKGEDFSQVSYTDPKTTKTWTGYINNVTLVQPSGDTDSEANRDTAQKDDASDASVKDSDTNQSQSDATTDDDQSQDDQGTTTSSDNQDQSSDKSQQVTPSDSSADDQQATHDDSKADTDQSEKESTPGTQEDSKATQQVKIMKANVATTTLHGIALKSKTNVYEKTSTGSKVLKSYPQGSVLKYESYSSDWYRCTVIINGTARTGYIKKGDVENEVSKQETLHGVGLKSPTKVYSKASTGSSVLKSYAQGSTLKYKTLTSGWYECTVIINNKAHTGYIKKSDVENVVTSQQTLHGVGVKSPTKVYSKASTNSTVLKSYAKGSVLKYKSFTSDWYECTVYVNGKATKGYIQKSDVENSVTKKETLHGAALKNPTKVYSDASTSSTALKSYAKGSVLKYKTFTSNWYECTIYVNGKKTTGYINKSDVENSVTKQETFQGVGLNSPTKVYSDASTSAKALKSYAQGSVLKYKTFTSDWYECTVYINGKATTGYIKKSTVENIVAKQETLHGIGLKSPTKVYSKASTGSKVLKSYAKGTSLKYKTFTSNWYECTVIINGKSVTGYFKKSDVGQQINTSYGVSLSDAIAMEMDVNPKADGLGQVDATADQVAYYLNPDNFARGTQEYFQFLILSTYSGTTASELDAKFLKGKGVLEGTGQYFIEAAKKYNINELYLISHALLETGNGTSNLAKGIVVNGKKVYNMYGINATDGNADKNGSAYAASQGWTSIEKAIVGGAQFVSENYIHNGQDTLYKMRWNPESLVNNGYASHQYATDVGWAVKQTYDLAQMYAQLTTFTLAYDLPSFSDDTVVLYKVTGITSSLNVRSSPSTASTSNVIGSLKNGDIVSAVISNGKSVTKSSEGITWYEIEYNGQKGWVSSEYLSKQ